MGWFKLAFKGLEYVGKIGQAEGFDEWLQGQGEAVLDSMVERLGFSLFGKRRAARKELLKQLKLAASSDVLRSAIDAEASDYTKLPGRLAERCTELPKSPGHRSVVVVPRFLINIVALNNAELHLGDSDALAQVHRHDLMKKYFFRQLVMELDKAFQSASFSPKKPFPSEDRWFIVGADHGYVWEDAFPGHFYLYETRSYEKRPDVNVVQPEIEKVSVWLGRLPKDEKEEVLRRIRDHKT